MAGFVALDWDQGLLRVAAGSSGRGGMHLDKAAVWQEEEALTPTSADGLGKRLRERLKSAGLAGLPLLISVGRAQVVLKEVHYPPVATGEEAALVHFQAAKDLTDAPDSVVIDYDPLPASADRGDRQALAVILRRPVVEAYQTLARVAGVKLLALTPRAYGLAAALRRAVERGGIPAPDPLQPTAILVLTRHWSELCVIRNEQVLFARPLSNGAGLAGEVRRNLAVLSHQFGLEASALALYLAGDDDHEALRRRLHDVVDQPIHFFDLFSPEEKQRLTLDNPTELAAAVGLLHGWHAHKALPINLAKPKEPPPPSPSRQNRLLVASILVALLFLSSGVFGYRVLANKKSEILRLNESKAELEEQFKLLAPDAKDIEFLKDWEQGSIHWLDELYDLAARFPHRQSLRLTSLRTELLGKRGPKDKYDARLALAGIVASEDERLIHGLVEAINHDSHCRATLERIKSGKTTSEFTIKIDLAKQHAERFQAVLKPPPTPPPPPPRPSPPPAADDGGEQ